MPLQKTTPEIIIRQSILVFKAKGYYRTTMSDLAAATGLTKGVFYHHFSNKEDVMKKCLQMAALWFEETIFSMAYDESLSKKERLVKMFDALFDALTQNGGGCIFANTILETAQVEDTFVPEVTLFFDFFENALTHIFKEKYTETELKETVYQIIADIEGTIIMLQLKKDPQLLRNALNRGINRF